jgi:integrase
MSTKFAAATDAAVRAIVRRARERRAAEDHTLGDGLQLRVGARRATFSLKYVDRRTGRQERVTLGYYPATSLAEARRRAKEHQARIEDPAVRASPARERRGVDASPTFDRLAEMRIATEGRHSLAPQTRDYYRWCLAAHASRWIGSMPASEVRTEDVISVVDRVARAAPTTADRVQAAIASVFTWGMRERIVASNPARGIARRAADAPRTRVPTDDEMRGLVAAIGSAWEPTASQDLRRILLLLLLTGARSSEVRLAEARDLRWEGHGSYAGPVWAVPGDRLDRGRRVRGRTKGGREKLVPLSRQAAALFREALGAAAGRDRLFDVAEGRAVSYAMARACSRAGLAGDERVTPHDFRRAVATWLGDRGERPDVIEEILGHSPKGVTRLHYNHSRLLPLVADALQRWADHLSSLQLR